MLILKQTWDMYQNNWRKFIPYIILLAIPTVAVQLVASGSLFMDYIIPSSSLVNDLVTLVVFIVSIVFSIWVSISVVTMTSKLLDKESDNHWKDELGKTTKYIIPVILASLLSGLIIMVGTILLIIPGIIFAGWYIFVYYEIVLNDKKVVESLSSSKKLVKGRWWAIIWRLIIIGLVLFIISAIYNIIVGGVLAIFTSTNGIIFYTILSISTAAFSAIITPYSVGAMVILYKDTKTNPVLNQASISTPNRPKINE